MTKKKLIGLSHVFIDKAEMIKRSQDFYQFMDMRRTVRAFSNRQVPKEVMENIIKTASTAPSGAHKQPWRFCLIGNPSIKREIRMAAEKEEKENYSGRMSDQWIKDLNPFGTNWEKEFLEIAPWHIVVFKRIYDIVDGKKRNNYYVSESVGIATGMLLTAIHNAGLVGLTHTPSPMNFLAKVLRRPANERAFLLIPVGYPAEDTTVPNIKRKELDEIISYF